VSAPVVATVASPIAVPAFAAVITAIVAVAAIIVATTFPAAIITPVIIAATVPTAIIIAVAVAVPIASTIPVTIPATTVIIIAIAPFLAAIPGSALGLTLDGSLRLALLLVPTTPALGATFIARSVLSLALAAPCAFALSIALADLALTAYAITPTALSAFVIGRRLDREVRRCRRSMGCWDEGDG
jgi:hypothetical protein